MRDRPRTAAVLVGMLAGTLLLSPAAAGPNDPATKRQVKKIAKRMASKAGGSLTPKIDANAAGIATNAGGVAANAGDIATNAGGVAANAGDIADNAADIAAKGTQISAVAAGNTIQAAETDATADVPDTMTDVVSRSITPGFWAIIGKVRVYSGAASQPISTRCQLVLGGTQVDVGWAEAGASSTGFADMTISLLHVAEVASATTMKIRCTDSGSRDDQHSHVGLVAIGASSLAVSP